MKQRKSLARNTLLFVSVALLIVGWIPLARSYEWEKTFGGSERDWASCVQQTTDGCYIMVGETESFGAGLSDVYLIKADGSGKELWSKTFGGSEWDGGISVQQTTDEGYIIAGYMTGTNAPGSEDVYLIKTDGEGNQLWIKTFGASSRDCGFSVQQTSDGGYIVVGETRSFGAGNSDVYLIKTDGSGNEIWSRTFGGDGYDFGYSVRETTDGGYIIVGETESFGAGFCDVYLIKTDGSGSEQWSGTFGGGLNDEGHSVQQTADGGYIIVGTEESFDVVSYDPDIYLIKTDSSGNEVWSRTFGGGEVERGYSVQQTSDEGFIIAGGTRSFGAGSADVYLIRTDANGNELWGKTFGGDHYDLGGSAQQTADGGYIAVGYAHSFGAGDADVYLIYYNPKDSKWETAYGSLFDKPSELDLLRRYRDDVLTKTPKGNLYSRLLYRSSLQALKVLLDNPGLMMGARDLIRTNKEAISDALNGEVGVIYNTERIVSFLEAYAKKSPLGLEILARIIKRELLRKQRQGQLFFGLRLQ